jgi:hypothetical protein
MNDNITTPPKVSPRERARAVWTRWRITYPASAALYDKTWCQIWDGKLARQPCVTCGEINGSPVFDWHAQAIASWACRKHRDAIKRELTRAAKEADDERA